MSENKILTDEEREELGKKEVQGKAIEKLLRKLNIKPTRDDLGKFVITDPAREKGKILKRNKKIFKIYLKKSWVWCRIGRPHVNL